MNETCFDNGWPHEPLERQQMSDMTPCTPIHCPHAGRISKLEAQQDHVAQVVLKMDGKLDQVLLALGRVEVLESKHAHHTEALGRAFARIESIEKQSKDTATALNDLMSQIKGVSRLAIVLWTVLGGTVGVLITKVFAG